MKTKYYIIDSNRPFDGFHINVVLENDKVMHWDIPFEEFKKQYEEKDQEYVLVTPEEHDKMLIDLRESLIGEFKEISYNEYELGYNGSPVARYVGSPDIFFVGAAHHFNLHKLCFKHNGKYYAGLRNVHLSNEEIYRQINEFTANLES